MSCPYAALTPTLAKINLYIFYIPVRFFLSFPTIASVLLSPPPEQTGSLSARSVVCNCLQKLVNASELGQGVSAQAQAHLEVC